ncbi:MAG: AMP-binding protein [Eubacterium sp.]|jgi:long-subunit acyl-CoA synthetase (AMP-forming)|nr:AMP-binding protein [Eubacterium sp.]MCH4046929.1 AMP-binding protein [Eubacterium sp.]MCH4080026.1 AMP-binding protein [Eubacterium sp.]MCH4109932.1 AMP-binding protein [Eubacterium sp.]MCI1307953.1 AMP-binding protein [Eubacterium sp.]
MAKQEIEKPLYDGRQITDLKDMITSSVELFHDHAAYLVKDKEQGKFVPITYGKVGEDRIALGTRMLELGLKGEKVAVIGPTSYYWLLTYFTVATGVGVIVPMDKNLPQGELLGLLERSGATAIVYDEKCRKTIEPLINSAETSEKTQMKYFISMDSEEHEGNVLSMKQLIYEGKLLASEGNHEYRDADVDPDEMSTLLFTSGTTGLAKGVMLSHRNITFNVYAMSKYFCIPDPGIVLSILPVHHVYEMTCDICTTFYQGKTIAICEGLRYIQKDMQEVHANVMLGVPLVFEKMYKGMFKQAKRRGEDEKLRRAIDLSKRLKLYKNKPLMKRMFKAIHQSFGGDMKYFIEGGAAADPFVQEEFEAMGLPLIQGYGMSECSPILALNPINRRKIGAAGLPLPDTQIRIINQDEDGIGEVIVKSPSVMMGYFENEEANKEALQNGWLHTGDLGYFDEDGYLFLTGRSKTVIVTKGGKNIFPEEVENVLLQNELIKEVLVHGVKDERIGNVMVTADIFPNYELLKETKGEMTKSEIYHFYRDLVDQMNESMPPYKQVKRINIRETEFVKTTTGKIKRYGNTVSQDDLKAASEGKADDHEIKLIEKHEMKDFIKEIRGMTDQHIMHKDLEPVTDIKDLILSSLEKNADAPAFLQRLDADMPYEEISYQRAVSDMEGLGTALINRNLQDDKIAVSGNNTYPLQISLLTAACGGGEAVMINKQLDQEEIIRQLNKTGVKTVIFDEKYTELFTEILESGKTQLKTMIRFGAEDAEKQEHEEKILSWSALIKEGKKQVSLGDRQYLDAPVLGSDPAAIFFTSGASGHAKAVELTHQNLIRNVISLSSLIRYDASDRVISVIAPNNVYQAAAGVLLPLYRGAAVVNCGGSDSLEQDLRDSASTIMLLEPVMMNALFDEIWDHIEGGGGDRRLDALRKIGKLLPFTQKYVLRPYESYVREKFGGKLRMMISGGSKPRVEVEEFFREMGINVLQAYGMTECSSAVAATPDSAHSVPVESVGHILPGVRVKVTGKGSRGIGELAVKGASVADGYMDDPEETDAAFKDGWFYTGDMGYVDDDNFVYIVGRKQTLEREAEIDRKARQNAKDAIKAARGTVKEEK